MELVKFKPAKLPAKAQTFLNDVERHENKKPYIERLRAIANSWLRKADGFEAECE